MEKLQKNYILSYNGKGKELFKVFITNWLFTIITLGFYYPWAKAKTLVYFYSQTTLNNEPFKFSGTGKEMFKGFIKALIVISTIYGTLLLFVLVLKMPIIGMSIFYLALFALIPFIIHGSLKYRLSRSSWRTIRFGYRGDLKELIKICFKSTLYTILSFGLYSSWFQMNVRRYAFKNIRLGDQIFEFKGTGGGFFGVMLGGYLLTILTLGIYSFWWIENIFNFYVENTKVYNKNEEEIHFKSTLTAGKIFNLVVLNLLILIGTLGFGFPWTITRTYKLITNSIKPEGNIDINNIKQTEANYQDATGEDMGDMLNLDII